MELFRPLTAIETNTVLQAIKVGTPDPMTDSEPEAPTPAITEAAKNLGINVPDNFADVFNKLEVVTNQRTGAETVANTSANFLTIFTYDHTFSDVVFNTLKGVPERWKDRKRTAWTDADDAAARIYIETIYRIRAERKCDDAFRMFLTSRKKHPVQELVKGLSWDGVKGHAENFLIKYLGCDDNDYSRECSRLIFSGAINRAFRPGCKFDAVIVLQGDQGAGKSTVVRWLALEDDFYTSCKTIRGVKGTETIGGKWIAELEELLATIANTRNDTAVEENAKAFLSQQSEWLRLPYDARQSECPRGNIFIGTTNKETFLTDTTGNRRWFPIHCNSTGDLIYSNKDEIQAEIRQAMAEMYAAFLNGDDLALPYERNDLRSLIKAKQAEAEEEDTWVGLAESYVLSRAKEGAQFVCLPEVWVNGINCARSYAPDMDLQQKRHLGEILTFKLGLERYGTVNFTGFGFGRQKGWRIPDGWKDKYD